MNFTEINDNGTVDGFCLVKSVELKKTAKGSQFLDMTLTDSSGEIGAKLWNYSEDAHSFIKVNDLIKIRGTISMFNDAPQLRVERVRPVMDSDPVKAEDFVPSADYTGEKMLNTITNIVNEFTNEELKTLVLEVINRNKEKMLYWPAAFRLHHAIRGGLLYHTLSILRMAQSVADIYPSVNKDLLFSGVILHDIAKIKEFNVSDIGVATGYSVDGNLLGHLVMGAMEIEKIGEELHINHDLLVLIEHMLISHHGEPEFGAAVRPMFLEAEILSELDMLDARIYEISSTVSQTEVGEFSGKQWALDNRKLYNHGLNETKAEAILIKED